VPHEATFGREELWEFRVATAVSDVNWKWLKNGYLGRAVRGQKMFSAPMIGFATNFALLQTEGQNAKENGHRTLEQTGRSGLEGGDGLLVKIDR